MISPMKERARRLQRSIGTIIRVLKIMEPSVQTVHGELKMTPSDLQTLRYIAAHPDCMSSAVANHLSVVPTTATSIVDRLVKRDFVSRVRPEENRRAVSLRLTAAGQDAFSRIDAEELATNQAMLDVLPEAERDQFVSAMTRIAEELTHRKSL